MISCVSFLVMKKGEHGSKGERERKKERKKMTILLVIKRTNARSGDRMLS